MRDCLEAAFLWMARGRSQWVRSAGTDPIRASHYGLSPVPHANAFPPIHQYFDRSSGSALATKGDGGVGMTLTPTASSRGERSPNLTESRSSVPWKKHERCVWCPRNLAIVVRA